EESAATAWGHIAEQRMRELIEASAAVDQLRNLLAVAHRDGGHHTEAVGLARSAADAERAVADMLGEIDVMRPLTATLIAMVRRARERMDPKLAAGLGQDLDRVLADAGIMEGSDG